MVDRIKGPIGSKVFLNISRGDEKYFLEVVRQPTSEQPAAEHATSDRMHASQDWNGANGRAAAVPCGVGLVLGRKDSRVMSPVFVVMLAPNGPAAIAGTLQKGDVSHLD